MTETGSHPTRERILKAAAELLAEGGSEAVSTRAVSARAGVQAPTLYRLFGDKQGMLDALISYGFDRYLADKNVGHARPGKAEPGPIDVLRVGWDLHVEFGLTQPSLYALMYGGAAHPGQQPAAAKDAHQKLLDVMGQVAAAGVLRVPTDTAAQMLQSAAIGVTLSLIANPDRPANAELSTRVRDAILAAITVGPDEGDTSSAADRLAALALTLDVMVKDHPEVLSEGESALLHEWLQRLATA
jgi:AcrR family transcriptional regulator